ncbi:MAG: hypothetical protein C0448_09810 [Sphingobacteriaceae bacterium]|nr:hypothetical protein [Sphingobacteriaceae bacterium]
MSAQNFNFIVGIGRSGTTLLMSMLNAHPSIQATPEVNFFNFFYSSWKDKTEFSKDDINLVTSYLNSYKANNFSGFDFDFDSFCKDSSVNFGQLYKHFYKSFLYGGVKKECSFYFDKNPINSLYLKQIIKTFPNAKFIFLTRDPRATYLSLKQKKNTKSINIYFNSYRWLLYNKEVFHYSKLYPNNFFVVKYEDLIVNTETELKRMATFFGFTYDEKMLLFHEDVKKFSFERINNVEKKDRYLVKYSDLSKPIYSDRLNAWETELNSEEINIIDSITSELALKLGYLKFNNSRYIADTISRLKGKFMAIKFIYYNKIVSLFPLKFKLARIKSKK